MTHPNTDQGVTAEDREAAAKVAVTAEWKEACLAGKCDKTLPVTTMRAHRLSSTAALEAEIASLKQRLESAEGLLSRWRTWACGQEGASPFQDTRTFLQEQEKQNG